MRIGFLGPAGTYSHEAVLADARSSGQQLVPMATIHDTIMAVHRGEADLALVPIENSLEGSVNPTLDALAGEADDVAIVGEAVHAIRHSLVARRPLELGEISAVVSHPQAAAQSARFLRTELARVPVTPAPSTADAVRIVAEADEPLAALGTRLAAELYGCRVLRDGVEDEAVNHTRFVWLAPGGTPPGGGERWKTSVVFWGAGDDVPGWLVRCLTELADRGVNLTMIESRPRRLALGHYLFFADLQGHVEDAPVAAGLEGLRAHAQTLRVLGSYPAA